MRPFAALTPWPEAVECAARAAEDLARAITVPPECAAGWTLAAPAVARVDVPNTDRAAMDGYAVRAADLSAGVTLRCVGRAAAGATPGGEIRSGECYEIATGATLPAGADTVVPVERTRREGACVAMPRAAPTGNHVVRRGSDIAAGATVVGEGEAISPVALAALVAAGVGELRVWRPPRVLIVPTGDEIVPAGGDLRPGQVYDSNALFLQAMLGQCGMPVARHAAVRDDREALERLFADADAEVIVTIGGTSVGRRDLVSEVAHLEGEVLFHGVAVKPGKPLLLARLTRGLLVGLPGFPATCMMLGFAFLRPLVERIARVPVTRQPYEADVIAPVSRVPGKTRLVPVAVREGRARPTFRGSAAVTSLAGADGWVELGPGEGEVAAGTRVRVQPF